jgi:hypothetical protein
MDIARDIRGTLKTTASLNFKVNTLNGWAQTNKLAEHLT